MPSAVELLPYIRGTLKMQARETVGPVKTCAEETGVDCQVPGRKFRTFNDCSMTAASGDFEGQ